MMFYDYVVEYALDRRLAFGGFLAKIKDYGTF